MTNPNKLGTWEQLEDIDGEAEDDKSGYSVSLNYKGDIVAMEHLKMMELLVMQGMFVYINTLMLIVKVLVVILGKN